MSIQVKNVSEFPGYSEALSLLNELSAQQEAELIKQRELADKVSEPARRAEPSPEDILAMHESGDLGNPAHGKTATPGRQLNESYIAYERLGRAIKVQHDRLASLREQAGRAALEECQPEYQALVHKLAAAADEVLAASTALRALDRIFIDAGMGTQASSASFLAGLPAGLIHGLEMIAREARHV